jgi:hypothetical protein
LMTPQDWTITAAHSRIHMGEAAFPNFMRGRSNTNHDFLDVLLDDFTLPLLE